jgi:hypothetical protein
MSSSKQLNGQCLCGAVEISAEVANTHIGACHCSTCRRWGGGPFLSIDCGSSPNFKGQESIAYFKSSDWAQRAFCRHCGTHLFYLLNANNQHIMPVGLFGDGSDYQFDHQIFIDEKPDFYDFANKTKNMTGAEVFAQFAP